MKIVGPLAVLFGFGLIAFNCYSVGRNITAAASDPRVVIQQAAERARSQGDEATATVLTSLLLAQAVDARKPEQKEVIKLALVCSAFTIRDDKAAVALVLEQMKADLAAEAKK